jgi:molybdate transport system regulatory protein
MPKWGVSQERLSVLLMANPRLRIRVMLANGAILDPSRIALLEAIAATGSISAAARSVDLSYRAAWQWVKSINDMLCGPAVVTEMGGRKGGGAKLTATGMQVVAVYYAIQSRVQTASAHELQALNAMTRGPEP